MSLVIENESISLPQIAGQQQVSSLFESGRLKKGSEVIEVRLIGFDGFGFAAVKECSQETSRGR
jgi:hypothetical protein